MHGIRQPFIFLEVEAQVVGFLNAKYLIVPLLVCGLGHPWSFCKYSFFFQNAFSLSLYVIFTPSVATICTSHFPTADIDICLLFGCLTGDLGYETRVTCMPKIDLSDPWTLIFYIFPLALQTLPSNHSCIQSCMCERRWTEACSEISSLCTCFWANMLLFLLVSWYGATRI